MNPPFQYCKKKKERRKCYEKKNDFGQSQCEKVHITCNHTRTNQKI